MEFIFIKVGKRNIKVNLTDILYIEGLANCSKIWLTGKRYYTAYMMMKRIGEILPPHQFCRIHKSYILSLRHFTAYDNHSVYIADMQLPIGGLYKKDFLSMIHPLHERGKKRSGSVPDMGEDLSEVTDGPVLSLN